MIIKILNDINKIIDTYDFLIFAIPSAFLTEELSKVLVSFEGKIIFYSVKDRQAFKDKNITVAFVQNRIATMKDRKVQEERIELEIRFETR